MKYQCTHCHHTFEAAEHEFRHCPKCFWTTSIEPLRDESAQTPSGAKIPPSQPIPKRIGRPPKILWVGAIFLGLIAAVFYFISSGRATPLLNISLKPIVSGFQHMKKDKVSKKEIPAPSMAQDPLSTLTAEEKTRLRSRFELTIPRPLSEDEEAILKKQVSFSFEANQPLSLAMWTKEDLKSFLKTEQARRKIPLGFGFNRAVSRLFEQHYLAAGRLIASGNMEGAREELLKAIAFPVYQNDIKLHRAVALVMLRPYINDVIGKITAINQHLMNRRLESQAETIFQAYRELFPILELKDWEEFLSRSSALRDQIMSFQTASQQAANEYPAAIGRVDQDIRVVLERSAKPDPKKIVDFKTLFIDLDLKERIARENMPEALSDIQKRYERALRFVEERNWQEAHKILKEIDYPPELVEEAAGKLQILEKIISAEESR